MQQMVSNMQQWLEYDLILHARTSTDVDNLAEAKNDREAEGSSKQEIDWHLWRETEKPATPPSPLLQPLAPLLAT